MPERSDFHHYSLFIFEAGQPADPHKIQNIFIYMESLTLSREERIFRGSEVQGFRGSGVKG